MKTILLIAASLLSISAFAHKAHTHGEGRLDAVIDKGALTLTLELPLDVLVGFERAPKNDKEKTALAQAETALKEAAKLFTLTPAANCAAQAIHVAMPAFDNDHLDVIASYEFRCANPAELKSVETTLFKQFKRLYRLEVQRIGPVGQGAQRLTPKNPVLGW
jgi:hypothetical protein